MPFTLKQNDTAPPWEKQLKEFLGTPQEGPYDLTGATAVEFIVYSRNSAIVKVDAPLTVVGSPVDGTVRYDWQVGDTDTVGYYSAVVRVTSPAGVETIPNEGYFDIVVDGPGLQTVPLISLDEYQEFANEGTLSADREKQVLRAIRDASGAAAAYADRDFGVPLAADTRDYLYDGSGVLEIDDASDVTEVKIDNVVLPPESYELIEQPTGIITLIALPTVETLSPEMGFTRNLDRLWPLLRAKPDSSVSVAGTFGWPGYPDTVKRAVFWTVQEWLGQPEGGDLQAESIATYARSWAQPGFNTGQPQAIPARARDLLDLVHRQVII